MRTMFVLAASFALAHTAHAYQDVVISNVKAGALATMCERPTDALRMDPCNSFIVGTADALQYGRMICITTPDGYPYVVVGVVRKYLADHPEHHGLPAVAVVDMALFEKFPCKKSR